MGAPSYVREAWADSDCGGCFRGPVQYFRKDIGQLGWASEDPDFIKDHEGVEHSTSGWFSMVKAGIARARQVLWMGSVKNRPNYHGLEEGVDEVSFVKYFGRVYKKDKGCRGSSHCA